MSSRRRLLPLYVAYCLLVVALVSAAAEWAARARGAAPWRPSAPGIRVEPGGRLYEADPVLGYRMRPGRYLVRFETGHAFHATHGEDSLRLARPSRGGAGAAAGEGGPEGAGASRELWIFGCSFTYGWAVDDEDVYAWQVQQRLPDWRVVNFAVNGYGTLQSLLQLERALDAGSRPDVVVLAYAAFHDDRNTFVRQRRKRVVPFSALGPLVQPYARLDGNGELRIEMADVAYREWPLMRRSALVHLAEQRWNLLERARADGPGVTRALVRRFVARARAAGAGVIVAGIAGETTPVLELAAELGATPLVMALDLDRPGMRNLPHDGHPSPIAHRRYAARLLAAVRTLSSPRRGSSRRAGARRFARRARTRAG